MGIVWKHSFDFDTFALSVSLNFHYSANNFLFCYRIQWMHLIPLRFVY
jgi:hypothetical protein